MKKNLVIVPTFIPDLKVIKRNPLSDNRGYLERLFCQNIFNPHIESNHVSQINRTLTIKTGSVRGMHYQTPPHAEIKFVSCLYGQIYDVAIDLRKDSPTFLKWHGEILTAENHKTMLIPKGFAHGFQTLTDNCELLYLHTAAYSPNAEKALNATDPLIAINWPLPISEMSPRDQAHPMIAADFQGICL